MNSMTGYGRSSATQDNLEISIEITSVNRRNLEISPSLPKDWQALERVIIETIRNKVFRGKISVYVKAKDHTQTGALSWNLDAVEDALNKLREFSKSQNIPFEATPDLVFNIAKSLTNLNDLPEAESIKETFESALKEALNNFTKMRAQEGSELAEDFKKRLAILKNLLNSIQDGSADALPRQRKLMMERLEKADIPVDLTDERILKEIALFADRCDISEEITRIESHLKQFMDELSAEGAIGRKLDFLCQEINREFNTVGSKTNLIEITHSVIEAKNELERIREQVQNIE